MTLAKEVDDAQHNYHGQPTMHRTEAKEVSITSLLPLLRDQAHYKACHVMDKVRDTVTLLNPGQVYLVPVITADQPLYALTKQIVLIFELEDCILKCI